MIPRRHLSLFFFLGLTLAFICAGCAPKTTETVEQSIEPPEDYMAEYPGAAYEAGDETYPGGYYIHTVKLADESISIIAKWFTGDLMNWELLAKCNPDINPNRIFLGDKIRVPRILITRQDPMTAEFVMESQPGSKRKKAASPSPVKPAPEQTETTTPAIESPPEPVEEDEPILFGPKG